MTIRLNGRDHDLDGPLSVTDLLARLGVASERVAVAVNREVVPRGHHAERVLADGDEVEILTAVAGG